MQTISRILTQAVILLCAAAAPLAAQEDVVRIENWRVHAGDDMGWASPDLDDSGWESSSWPRRYASAQPFFAGTRWYRATPSIPAGFAGRPLAIAVGPLNEVFDLFVNGVCVGTHGSWDPCLCWWAT
jgi:hypothetical protein